jgi:hypothetical protein
MKLLIVFASLMTSVPALATNKALVVSIFGMGPPVDARAYAEVLKLTGGLIEENRLESYLVKGFGREGGSEFCIQLNHFQSEATLQQIQDQYLAITPNRQTTSYTVNQIPNCSGYFSKN